MTSSKGSGPSALLAILLAELGGFLVVYGLGSFMSAFVIGGYVGAKWVHYYGSKRDPYG